MGRKYKIRMTKYADLTSAKTTFTSLFENDISEQIKDLPNGSKGGTRKIKMEI